MLDELCHGIADLQRDRDPHLHQRFVFRVSGFGIRVSGFRFESQVSGTGFRVDRLARRRVVLGEVREQRVQGASRGILDEHAGRAVGVGGHAEQRREVRVPPERHKHLHLPAPTSRSIFRKMHAACSIAQTAFAPTHTMDQVSFIKN